MIHVTISPGRRGFSLLELVVTVALLALLALSIQLLLEGEPDRALEIRTREELARFRTALQLRSLGHPRAAIVDLATALELPETPTDPWGQPYQLLGPRTGPATRPELELQLVSFGPDGFPDGDTRTPGDTSDDMSVPVRLANPAYTTALPERSGDLPEGQGGSPPVPESVALSVPVTSLDLFLEDWDAPDGDRVDVRLDGLPLVTGLVLSDQPSPPLRLELRPGINDLVVTAAGTGGRPPCTVAVNFLMADSPCFRLRLASGRSTRFRIDTGQAPPEE